MHHNALNAPSSYVSSAAGVNPVAYSSIANSSVAYAKISRQTNQLNQLTLLTV